MAVVLVTSKVSLHCCELLAYDYIDTAYKQHNSRPIGYWASFFMNGWKEGMMIIIIVCNICLFKDWSY